MSTRASRRYAGGSYVVTVAILIALLLPSWAVRTEAVSELAACQGDCNQDGVPTIYEVIRGVRILLGLEPVSSCLALDPNGDGEVTVDELMGAIQVLLEGCPPPVDDRVTFLVRIENVSMAGTLQPSDGSRPAVLLSPGVWVVHVGDAPLFRVGEPDRGKGLEAIAEDGDSQLLAQYLVAGREATGATGKEGEARVAASAVSNMVVGGSEPAPAGPGEAFEFLTYARPKYRLSFTTMFVQSNDLFYGPGEAGIALFDDAGNPISGDVTDQILLWDLGAELNQEPGVGVDQAPRQTGPNTGVDENGVVLGISDVNDGYTYPAVADVVRATIKPFTERVPIKVRVENVSTLGTLQPSDGSLQAVPISPGVWALHDLPASLFAVGEFDRGEGLEALAEDGNPGPLAESLVSRPGIRSSGIFDTPVGEVEPVLAARPSQAFEFTVFPHREACYLSLATMLVPSNDLFYAAGEMGIVLFDEQGNPSSGDVTDQVRLWDAGT